MKKRAVAKFFLIFLLAMVLVLSGCSKPDERKYDTFAKCMTEKGAVMYGSFTCAACRKQRKEFGASFDLIKEIECHPRGENSQTDLCLKKDISKTPTWMLEKNGEEVKRLVGYQSFESLAELAGCKFQEDITNG